MTNAVEMAIVSDLHCHRFGEGILKESFLGAGDKRTPTGRHPVQSLIELIRRDSLRSNVLICPGDLANKVSSEGMIQAFDHLREIQSELNASLLLTTLGNHDVDSRREKGNDPFMVPRTLHPDFPTSDAAGRQQFWAEGFYFAELSSEADFLILNSVVDHHDEASAKQGTFSFERLDTLKRAMISRYGEGNEQRQSLMRIAVMHHHPIVHSTIDYSSSDTLPYGDQLIGLLSRFRYSIVIHGHRHDPRLSRFAAGGQEMLVLAAGAFSAFLRELSSTTRNLFHIISACQSTPSEPLRGQLLTWEFNYGTGWRPATVYSASMQHIIGYSIPRCYPSIPAIVSKCTTAPGRLIKGVDVAKHFGDILSLLPAELDTLNEELHKHGVCISKSVEGSIEAIGLL